MSRRSSDPFGPLVALTLAAALLFTAAFGAYWHWLPVLAAVGVGLLARKTMKGK